MNLRDILLVIAIIAILSAILFPRISGPVTIDDGTCGAGCEDYYSKVQ